MKKIIAIASALSVMLTVTNAQTDSTQATSRHHRPQWGGGEKKGKWHGGEMAERWGHHGKHGKFDKPRLNLTQDQKNQAKAINEGYEKQVAALYDNDKLRLGDLKKKVALLNKEKKDKLAAILTPEQKQKMEAFKAKREENIQVMAAAHLERMKIELGLKDEQVTSIKAAEESLHEKMKSLHEDATILPEQKRSKMKALREQHKETVNAILTPDQQSKLQTFKKHWDMRG